jgi:hypothetical protein
LAHDELLLDRLDEKSSGVGTPLVPMINAVESADSFTACDTVETATSTTVAITARTATPIRGLLTGSGGHQRPGTFAFP